MVRVIFNDGLSSRESEVLRIFRRFEPNAVSTETVRLISGYDQKSLHRTFKKLLKKGYLKRATVCRLQFFKLDE